MSEYRPKRDDEVRVTVRGRVTVLASDAFVTASPSGRLNTFYYGDGVLSVEKITPTLPRTPGSVIRHEGRFLWALNNFGEWVSLMNRKPITGDRDGFGNIDVLYDAGKPRG